MKKQQKSKPYSVPTSIQKVFVYGMIALYLIQAAIMIVPMLMSGGLGNDYLVQFGYLTMYNLVPVIVFAAAYLLNPRPLARLSKAFEAMLISILACIAWICLLALSSMFGFSVFGMTSYQWISYISALVFLVPYFAILVIVRQKRVWA